MDECYTENNNSTRKLRCLNEQVENLTNKITTCSEEICSLDQFNFNSDAKSSLLTKKQRLKEYLTTANSSEIDITPTNEVYPLAEDKLIDISQDSKWPVKVKSRWTHSSQMELAQEYSVPLHTKNTLPVDNLFQPPEVMNEFPAPIKLRECTVDLVDIYKKKPPLKCLPCIPPVHVKRKRGRPKKTVILNIDSPVVSDVGDSSTVSDVGSSPILSDIEKEDLPKIVKRGRGRPKKNEVTSNIVQTPQLALPKKRGRKKRSFPNTNSIKNGSNSEMDSESSTLNLNVQPNITCKINSMNNSSENDNSTTSNDSKTKINIDSCNIYDVLQTEVSSKDNCLLKCVETHGLIPDTEVSGINPSCLPLTPDCVISSSTLTTESSYNLKVIDQNELLEFNKVVNCIVLPKKKRSNSVDEFTKVKERRNSLSDNFVFDLFDITQLKNESTKLKKSWKSLSYIEGGPNIQIERNQHNELNKKFRTELKRSRSFPNCMLLDTIIWRFLVYEQNIDCDENDILLSNCDVSLINELPVYEYNHQYRSKSVPLEFYQSKCAFSEFKKETNTQLSRSQDNLNVLSNINDLSTFKISSDVCDLKDDDESDPEENECKIRRSKRLNTKIKDYDMLEEEYLSESEDSKVNYLLKAEQIRQENERQLSEAKRSDQELEDKLKKLGFTLITNNLFRPPRKEMSEYTPIEVQELRRLKPKRIINTDTYQCHCKYSKKDFIERLPGCGSECLNRLLNIECGSSCSLKSHCTNKQFQNKQFKRTQIVRTSDKGYGVFALEDIPSGTFVDEYMGEVIDQHEMIKRMKTKLYRNNNYMVQLKHDEIIDATRKGNITRFINHSCDPNCVAEKWNVLGESRMGFFSKYFIQKGEEITFDYSFEIFGDTAQQKCYCGTPKCRGYISKKSRTGDQSSSDESDDNENTSTIKSDERGEKKKKIAIKKISNKDKKRLRELDQQLTDISKLKNKNRSDLENSTLNLNKLMVHITDSMSRLHILKFIRENDLNCKRLFMNFNGLSIIHTWMISNNNERLKLEIIETLSELPISNRNTITKSKVIDIVAEWANIPKNIKEDIENLEYPVSKIEDHEREVNKLLPHINNISSLVKAARVLWKKWIILKMVFIIPKLDRAKEEVNITDAVISEPEVNISDAVISKPPIYLSRPIPKPDQYSLTKSATSWLHAKINHENPKTKINMKYGNNQVTPKNVKTNSLHTFSKIINHQNQINNRDKNKAILQWNKNHHFQFSSVKRNIVNGSKQMVLNAKHSPKSIFKSKFMLQEIPTIGSGSSNHKIKWSNTIEVTSKVYEVPTHIDTLSESNRIFETEFNKGYPIEEIITSKHWMPPKIDELHDTSTLDFIWKMPPPCLPNTSCVTSLCIMKPENVFYDAKHPSFEEQNSVMPIQAPVDNNTVIQIINTDLDSDIEKVPPVKKDTQKALLRRCEYNFKNLFNNGLLDCFKSAGKNYIDQSPMKISESFFKKNSSKAHVQPTNKLEYTNVFKCLKIGSNFYKEQPSKIIKINNFESKTITSKNNVFRIKEKKSEKSDAFSVAWKLNNKQLITTPQNLNVQKLLKRKHINLNTENKFALKLFNGLLKKCHTLPNLGFTIKLPIDTKNYILDPMKELELHHKSVLTVKNSLCAKLIRDKDTLNVFKQNIIMKYDESKPVPNMELISKRNQVLNKSITKSKDFYKASKRKMSYLSAVDTKKQKLVNSSVKNINYSRNQVKIKNHMDDSEIFKKPMIPVHVKKVCLRNNTSRPSQQRINTSSIPMLKTDEKEIRKKTGPPNNLTKCTSQTKLDANVLRQGTSTSNKLTSSITSSETNTNEIRHKPFMKCTPFTKVNKISAIDLEQNVKSLAANLIMGPLDDNISPSSKSSSEQITSIVEHFNTTINVNKTMVRTKPLDDPIVREYIQSTQLKSLEIKRKYKLPESMLSLPIEVLNLVPDNQREIKYVIDFYHSMATVIVKVLDLYVKKSCKQARIKNDEDFKYLAKKLNSNILYKELQVKKVEELKISDNVKKKVEQYIKKYMLKFGKLYRRKSTDQ